MFCQTDKTAQKSEQRKLLGVLCLQGLQHASRARKSEEKMCYLGLLYERERERESIQLFGTTK